MWYTIREQDGYVVLSVPAALPNKNIKEKNEMKKIVSLALAILMVACLASVFASADVDPEIGVNRAVSIYETETAPVVDGVVNEGEYGDPIAVWPTDSIMQYKGDYAKNIDVKIYMCYDAENLYYAVVTECDDPHIAYNEGDHYIFNAHHVMSMILPDDPLRENEDGSFVYPDASGYDWGVLNAGGFCYEWTMIFNSKTNAPEADNHFLGLTKEAGVKFSTSSANGYDTYEIVIPWTAMKSTAQPEALKGEDGTVFGFDCDLGLTDYGTGYDSSAGNFVYFGGCYTTENAKNLRGCAIVTCAGKNEEPASEPSSEPVSEPTSDKPTTPTSDSGIIALAVIASLAVAGAVITKKVR